MADAAPASGCDADEHRPEIIILIVITSVLGSALICVSSVFTVSFIFIHRRFGRTCRSTRASDIEKGRSSSLDHPSTGFEVDAKSETHAIVRDSSRRLKRASKSQHGDKQQSPAVVADGISSNIPLGSLTRKTKSTSGSRVLIDVASGNGAEERCPRCMAIHALFYDEQPKVTEPEPSLAREAALPDPPSPQTAREFQRDMNSYVKDSGLQKFFPQKYALPPSVAHKAAELRKDPASALGSSSNVRRLARLSLYRLIIYCDDSSSMQGQKYQIQSQLVSRIVRIATRIAPDGVGVDLHFINGPHYDNIKADQVPELVSKVQPEGGTPIGTVLEEKILTPQVYEPLSQRNPKIHRPLLICIITDGCPTTEDPHTLKNAVVKCRQTLLAAGYQSTAVRFSVSQIGNDQDAESFLDELRSDKEIREIVRCTTDRLDAKYEALRQNEKDLEAWVLEMLTNPIVERAVF